MYLCTQWGTEHVFFYAVGDRACIFVCSRGQSMYLCMQWGQSMYLCINCMQWGTEHVSLYAVGDRAHIFVCSGGQSMYLCMQLGTKLLFYMCRCCIDMYINKCLFF